MGNVKDINYGDTSKAFIFFAGIIFLFVWVADFWASKYRANIIYLKREKQDKKGISLIGGYGYLHIFTSLTMAGVIGSLLGSLINAIAVFIPILVITALIKEFILISKIIKSRKNPTSSTSTKKTIVSDVILLFYAYLVFIVSWQSFVYSGNFIIDFEKTSALFMLFLTLIIYLIFYLGACWLWFEEITVNLKTQKQKLYFIAAFLFEVVMVIIKLIK